MNLRDKSTKAMMRTLVSKDFGLLDFGTVNFGYQILHKSKKISPVK